MTENYINIVTEICNWIKLVNPIRNKNLMNVSTNNGDAYFVNFHNVKNVESIDFNGLTLSDGTIAKHISFKLEDGQRIYLALFGKRGE